MEQFKKLGLGEGLLKVVEELKFSEPSEIQAKVIPLALAGKDVIGESATGSGKTLAFGAPIIEKLKSGEGLRSLILTPTRELCEQVAKSLKVFSKHNSLSIISVYGGVSLNPQIEDLESADVVVGTPGRILDHISRRTIDLSKVEILVLDEADRMLDMGFLPDVTEIIEHCPKNRQTLLFSATVSQDIKHIAKKYMNHPTEISVESYVDASKLEQIYYDVPQNEKFSLLVHLLKKEDSKLVIVFCNTKRNADFIGKSLKRYELDAMALHGDLSQNKRNWIIEHFHKSEKLILVCTDVAARGLDIKNVSHVYNYDCPKNSTDYVHRIGRTARAGKEGKAITILAQRDYENFRRVIENPDLNIVKLDLPEFEKVFVKMGEHSGQGFGGRSFGGRDGGRSYGGRGRFGGSGGDRGGRGSSRFGGRGGGTYSRGGYGGRSGSSSGSGYGRDRSEGDKLGSVDKRGFGRQSGDDRGRSFGRSRSYGGRGGDREGGSRSYGGRGFGSRGRVGGSGGDRGGRGSSRFGGRGRFK